MNSYTMYGDFCRDLKKESAETKMSYIDKLVEHIHDEITEGGYDVSASAFLTEAEKTLAVLIDGAKGEISVGRVDVYVIVDDLMNRLEGNTPLRTPQSFTVKHAAGLFNPKANINLNAKQKMIDTREKLSGIQKLLKEMKPDETAAETEEETKAEAKTAAEGGETRFAEMLIEVYNQIADYYAYHVEAAPKSGNGDYLNAVGSYVMLMDTVLDQLSALGVEEISTEPGEPYDSRIHLICERSGSSAETVKRSLRSGFRYGDVILQEENVTV